MIISQLTYTVDLTQPQNMQTEEVLGPGVMQRLKLLACLSWQSSSEAATLQSLERPCLVNGISSEGEILLVRS